MDPTVLLPLLSQAFNVLNEFKLLLSSDRTVPPYPCLGLEVAFHSGMLMNEHVVAELLHVLFLISCCPGFAVDENEAFWRQLLGIVVRSSTIMETVCLKTMRRHLLLHLTTEEIDWRVDEFFQWSPESSRSLNEFDALVRMIEPYVATERLAESIHVILSVHDWEEESECADFQSSVEELRASIPRRAVARDSSSSHLSLVHSYLDSVKCKWWSSGRRSSHDSLQYGPTHHCLEDVTFVELGAGNPTCEEINSTQYWVNSCAVIKQFLRQCDPISRGLWFQLTRKEEWAASVLTSLFQQRNEVSLILGFKSITSVRAFAWILYGIFQDASCQRFHRLAFWFDVLFTEDDFASLHKSLSSTTPGAVLVPREVYEPLVREKIEYPSSSTKVLLCACPVDMECFGWHERHGKDVAYSFHLPVKGQELSETPCTVLATTPTRVGVLVPGSGFGWISRSDVVLLCETPTAVESPSNDRVNHLLLRWTKGEGRREDSSIPRGTVPLFKAMKIAPSRLSITMSSLSEVERGDWDNSNLEQLVEVFPTIDVLEVTDRCFDWVEKAYSSGRCHAPTLVAHLSEMDQHIPDLEDEALQDGRVHCMPVLRMLHNPSHAGFRVLRHVRINVMTNDEDDWQGLDHEILARHLRKIIRVNQGLWVFELTLCADDWNDSMRRLKRSLPTPNATCLLPTVMFSRLLALLSVRDAKTGAGEVATTVLNPDTLAHILLFVGVSHYFQVHIENELGEEVRDVPMSSDDEEDTQEIYANN